MTKCDECGELLEAGDEVIGTIVGVVIPALNVAEGLEIEALSDIIYYHRSCVRDTKGL